MSWPPCATPRSMSADSPGTPTSPRPNATTAGHPTPPSTPSSPHDQLDHRSSAPFHDLAMPLGLGRWQQRSDLLPEPVRDEAVDHLPEGRHDSPRLEVGAPSSFRNDLLGRPRARESAPGSGWRRG